MESSKLLMLDQIILVLIIHTIQQHSDVNIAFTEDAIINYITHVFHLSMVVTASVA